MTEEKSGLSPDLQALAREACDLWQEHLATYANDPEAKEELMRLLAPSRQLFAEWATLMQNGFHGANFGKTTTAGEKGGGEAQPAGGRKQQNAAGSYTARTAAAGPASDGSAIELAELADRVAKLEQRLTRRDAGNSGKAEKPRTTSGRSKS